MNVIAWQRTCRHNPPPNDSLGTHVEVLDDMEYAPELVLPAMLASVRFGVGLPLWPETTEAARGSLS